MKALVVHESMFGNTETIAHAVADGLSSVPGVEVDLAAVRAASSDLSGVDLLVVGGPTHAFSMSRASTRAGDPDLSQPPVAVAVTGRGPGRRPRERP